MHCETRPAVYWFHTSLARTDEGTACSYLNCLDLAAINVHVDFLTKFPTREARRSHRRHTFLENLSLQLLWLWRSKEVPQLPKTDGCPSTLSQWTSKRLRLHQVERLRVYKGWLKTHPCTEFLTTGGATKASVSEHL